jgi:catalase (peroxidase I)
MCVLIDKILSACSALLMPCSWPLQVIADDPECRTIIDAYAKDQQRFFSDFSAVYIKLTGLGAAWV